MSDYKDPLTLARALIKCQSVTPNDGGALATLVTALDLLGFECWRLPFSEEGTEDVEEPPAPVKALVQPDMNTMMLLGLGVLLVAFFFRKEIQEFLSPKSSSE